MGEQILVAGSKYETAAELKRVLADPGLAVARRLGTGAGSGIVAAQEVQNIRVLQARLAIGPPLLVNEKRKCDASIFAKHLGVSLIAQANRR